MNNSATFNLLKFVEHYPLLSARKIFFIVILFLLILLSYSAYQRHQFNDDTEKNQLLEDNVLQMEQKIQPLLQHGATNPLAGVLPSNFQANKIGFDVEFTALSQVQVKGLWLTRVEIKRNPAFIKITGAMDSADKLDILLKQLAAQPAFKSVKFVGINVGVGIFSDIPEKYKTEVAQLKFPTFYHFVIQTTPLSSPGGLE